MKITLERRTVFMTGAVGAIAEAVIKTLAGAGAKMVLTDRMERDQALPILEGYGIGPFSYYEMGGISAYVASKAALEMFAKNIALEYAPYGIRVNCISPGTVAAGSSKRVYDNDEVYRAWVDRISPLGKRNSAQGIANA